MIDSSRIWRSAQLPTLPTAALKLLELARDPEADLHSIISVIKTDPATAAKLLKAANASYFGFANPVTSIERAVPRLGMTVVTSLALSFYISEASQGGGPAAPFLTACWRQSAVQAAAAEVLGNRLGDSRVEDYGIACLLSDLGRLAMLKTIPNEYLEVLMAAEGTPGSTVDLERQMLGFDHVEISTKLMALWKLPPALRRAAEFHHATVETILAEQAADDYPLIRAVAVAAAIGEYCCEPNKAVPLQRVRQLSKQLCGIPETDIDEFIQATAERFENLAELYNVRETSLPDPAELMGQANQQLAELAMSQHVATTQVMARQRQIEQQNKELEERNASLQQEVRHDPLTRLYNRAYFAEAYARELVRAARSGESIGLLFCDIDRFKNLNDTYGHPFGDTVLKTVSHVLGKTLRRSDVLARYGGEEFIVLVSHPTEAGLKRVAERLCTDVAALDVRFGETQVPVTISIGGAIALPQRQEQELGAKLLNQADSAMYDAKRAGRNQVQLRCLLNEDERRLAKLVAARRFSRWLVARGLCDPQVIGRVLLKTDMPRRPIGQLARQRGLLTEPQIEELLQEQMNCNARFGELAMSRGYFNEAALADLLARQQEDPRRLADALVAEAAMDAVNADAFIAAHVAGVNPQPVAALKTA